jgi:GntR family transcriptional regulator
MWAVRLDREGPLGIRYHAELHHVSSKPSVTKTPVYLAIAEALRDDIASKKIAPHTRLSTEPELARRYGAARETVRRALGKLQEDGVVYRRQNVGTFVAEPRVDQDLDQLFSFTEYMMFRGLKPGSVLLSSETVRIQDADSPILHYLGLKAGARVIHLRRLRTGSNEPLVIASTWLPEARFRGFLKRDLRRQSVYDVMKEMGGRPTDAVQTMTAVTLDAEQAKLLSVAPGAPAFMIRRLGLSHGMPVEFAIDYYRGDRTTFRVRLGILEQRFSSAVQADHILI